MHYMYLYYKKSSLPENKHRGPLYIYIYTHTQCVSRAYLQSSKVSINGNRKKSTFNINVILSLDSQNRNIIR